MDKLIRYIVCTLFALVLLSVANAQFYLINDKDGFVNVREKPGTDGKIISRLNNGSVVYEGWDEDAINTNWIYVEFYVTEAEGKSIKAKPKEWIPDVMEGYILSGGYVYKDRLIKLEQYDKLEKKWSGNDFIFFNDSVKIVFTPARFEKEKHAIEKKEEYQVVKIDDHYLAGTDGSLPNEEIKDITIEIKGRKINFPKNAYHDLYEPNFDELTKAVITQNGIIYIIMYNSDAAGTYQVIFVINDGQYFTRYVFDGEF